MATVDRSACALTSDTRLVSDDATRSEIAALCTTFEYSNPESFVSIVQSFVSKGHRYLIGRTGQFPDRVFALAFMDEHPDMFPATFDYVLAYTERDSTERVTIL